MPYSINQPQQKPQEPSFWEQLLGTLTQAVVGSATSALTGGLVGSIFPTAPAAATQAAGQVAGTAAQTAMNTTVQTPMQVMFQQQQATQPQRAPGNWQQPLGNVANSAMTSNAARAGMPMVPQAAQSPSWPITNMPTDGTEPFRPQIPAASVAPPPGGVWPPDDWAQYTELKGRPGVGPRWTPENEAYYRQQTIGRPETQGQLRAMAESAPGFVGPRWY